MMDSPPFQVGNFLANFALLLPRCLHPPPAQWTQNFLHPPPGQWTPWMCIIIMLNLLDNTALTVDVNTPPPVSAIDIFMMISKSLLQT